MSDEPIGWEPIGEEFSSEPVFNNGFISSATRSVEFRLSAALP